MECIITRAINFNYDAMTLLILSISHKTASVSVREKVAFPPDLLFQALESLKKLPFVLGVVILSTCNRTELYINHLHVDAKFDAGYLTEIINWLCQFLHLEQTELIEVITWYQDKYAIEHLMSVASGLDSLILGEPQILGQVKTAFSHSQSAGVLSPELERLFQKAFSVAKRVRTETEIGSSAVSVAFAACILARQIFESLSNLTILLIGAGETIALVAKHLRRQQVGRLIIANRTIERAKILAAEVAAEYIGLSEIEESLHKVDIVFSSTASSLPLVNVNMVEKALKRRKYQPILFIDIAVPRDIAPEVGDLSDIYLYTVDDLHAIIEHNLAQREIAATQARVIIQQESQSFLKWQSSQDAVESIRCYRTQAEQIKNELLNNALNALSQGTNANKVINELAHKLTNRLIHDPTKSLQQAASEGDLERLALLRSSFGLDKN